MFHKLKKLNLNQISNRLLQILAPKSS